MKMKMLTALIAGIAVLFSVQSYAGIIESLPAETRLVAKADMQALKGSDLYKSVREKFASKFLNGEAMLLQASGLDFNKVKTLWLAAIEENKGVFVIEGDFNANDISAAVSANRENEIVTRTGSLFAAMCPDKRQNKKNLAILIDRNTAVVGDPIVAEEFLKYYTSGKGGMAPEKISSLNACFSGSYIIKASLLGFKPDDLVKNPFLANVTAAEICISFTNGLTADAKLLMKGEENVMAVEQIIKGFVSIAKANPNADEKSKEIRDEFFNNLSINRNGLELTASTKIAGDTIDRLISMQEGEDN